MAIKLQKIDPVIIPNPQLGYSYIIIDESGTLAIKQDDGTITYSGGGGVSNLYQLSDVHIVNVVDGQTLVYDSATSKWKNDDAAPVIDLSAYWTSGQTVNYLQANYYTTSEIISLLNNYYTKNEITTLLSQKSTTGHTHVQNDITDLDVYSQSEINILLTGKENTGYSYSKSEVNNIVDDYLPLTGGSINGSLSISGDLNISGTTYSQNYEQVNIANNYVVLNSGETGAGVTRNFAGTTIDRGSLPDYNFGFFENTDNFRVGETGDEKPLAVREDSPIEGGIAVWEGAEYRFKTVNADSFTSGITADITKLQTINTDVAEPTGFLDTSNIIVTYDLTGRTITLSNTNGIYYYFKGEKKTLGNSWTSSAHNATDVTYYLSSNDGINFTWSTSIWNFAHIQVAVKPAGCLFAMKEIHGTMQHEVHQEFHQTIGTYRVSGFGFTIGTYSVQPAVPTTANSQVGFESGVIADEDLQTSIPSSAGASYTRLHFTSTGTTNFETGTTELFRVDTTYPKYNGWNGTTFSETEMASGNYSNYYVIRIPVTSDSDSQKYRAVVLQPQYVYNSLAAAQAENPSTLYLGGLSSLIAEFILVERITMRTNAAYNGAIGRVRIEAVSILTGTRFTQASSNVGSATTAGNVSVTPVAPYVGTNLQTYTDELAGDIALKAYTSSLSAYSLTSHTHSQYLTGVTIPTLMNENIAITFDKNQSGYPAGIPYQAATFSSGVCFASETAAGVSVFYDDNTSDLIGTSNFTATQGYLFSINNRIIKLTNGRIDWVNIVNGKVVKTYYTYSRGNANFIESTPTYDMTLAGTNAYNPRIKVINNKAYMRDIAGRLFVFYESGGKFYLTKLSDNIGSFSAYFDGSNEYVRCITSGMTMDLYTNGSFTSSELLSTNWTSGYTTTFARTIALEESDKYIIFQFGQTNDVNLVNIFIKSNSTYNKFSPIYNWDANMSTSQLSLIVGDTYYIWQSGNLIRHIINANVTLSTTVVYNALMTEYALFNYGGALWAVCQDYNNSKHIQRFYYNPDISLTTVNETDSLRLANILDVRRYVNTVTASVSSLSSRVTIVEGKVVSFPVETMQGATTSNTYLPLKNYKINVTNPTYLLNKVSGANVTAWGKYYSDIMEYDTNIFFLQTTQYTQVRNLYISGVTVYNDLNNTFSFIDSTTTGYADITFNHKLKSIAYRDTVNNKLKIYNCKTKTIIKELSYTSPQWLFDYDENNYCLKTTGSTFEIRKKLDDSLVKSSAYSGTWNTYNIMYNGFNNSIYAHDGWVTNTTYIWNVFNGVYTSFGSAAYSQMFHTRKHMFLGQGSNVININVYNLNHGLEATLSAYGGTNYSMSNGDYFVYSDSSDSNKLKIINDSETQFLNTKISNLADVSITSPSNGQVLTFSGNTWVNATSSGSADLSGYVRSGFTVGNISNQLTVYSNGSGIYMESANSGEKSYLSILAGANLYIGVSGSTGQKFFEFGTAGIYTNGMAIYAADYSASYTDRTLVDRGYVINNFAAISHTHTSEYASLSAYNTFTGTTNTTLDGKVDNSTYNTFTGTTYINDLAGKSDKLATISSRTGATTLTQNMNNYILECSETLTITVPSGLTAGTQIAITNVGATKTITFSAGSGMTLRSADSKVTITKQYAMATLYYRTSTEVLISGNLA